MKRKTVSLCMIARDEEATIGRAIKSVLALVDEIVVVDTGSLDNTRIIAEGYGARVVDQPWHDDFAAARNAGLAAVTGDWILVLDGDEHLQGVRPLEFQRLLADPEAAGYRLRIAGPATAGPDRAGPAIRLFRNHPEARYQYPVHEQISPSLLRLAGAAGLRLLDAPLVVVHDPGGADQISRKRERNLRLLRQAMLAAPEEPYFAYLLGSETLSWLDDEVLPVCGLASSLQHLETAWRLVAARAAADAAAVPFASSLAGDLAAALQAVGRPDAAVEVVAAGRRAGDSVRLCLQAVRAGLACLARQEEPRRREALAAGVRRDLQLLAGLLASEPGDRGRRRRAQRLRCEGDLALAEGRVGAAAEAFEQALDQDRDHAAAWVGLAECARLAGDRKRALRLYLRAVTASEWNVQAWERGCSLMEELGFRDNAESWRATVKERFPERPAAHGAAQLSAPR